MNRGGIGIAPEKIDALFNPFQQAHGTVSRRAGGVGLGLYIVARLVTLIGGTIAVQSTPGRGTAFGVRIPLVPAVVTGS